MSKTSPPFLRPFQKYWAKNQPSVFKNSYQIILGLFVFWIAFIDKHNLITQYRLNAEIGKLKAKRVLFQKKLEEVQRETAEARTNKERLARELYYMRAANEDVFVIQKKE